MEFWSLKGWIPYSKGLALQQSLVDLRVQDQLGDTVLFLEHLPVITRGRGLQFTGENRPKQMPFSPPVSPEIEFFEIERGGDLTYHGPGQWVMYPICKLNGQGFAPFHDVSGFLRKLEAALIDELKALGLDAGVKPQATGVWIQDKKVASIGIAVRKWVTFHGLALNCINDLKPFYGISPCGFAPEVMTRLLDWIPMASDELGWLLWRDCLEKSMACRLASEVSSVQKILKLSLQEVEKKISSLKF